MKQLPNRIDAAATGYLAVLDSLIDAAMILITSLHGASGVTETHAPVHCRFCGADSCYGSINHKPECKFGTFMVAYSKYCYMMKEGSGCLLTRYEASLAYCDAVVAFLEDLEVLAVVETDDQGRSNVEKLQPLYTARDQYLTTFPRGR